MLRSLGLSIFNGSVVEESKLLHVQLSILVEENSCARSPLELNKEQVLCWYFLEINLNLSALHDGLRVTCFALSLLAFRVLIFTTTVTMIVDLPLDAEVDAPRGV